MGERAERALSAPARGGAATPEKRQEQAASIAGRPSRATGVTSGPADDPVRPEISIPELLSAARALAMMPAPRRARVIRRLLGISQLTYTSLLNRAIDLPETFALDPSLVGRLRRLRETRRAARRGSGPGRSSGGASHIRGQAPLF